MSLEIITLLIQISFLAIGLAIIYWYANKMLAALAKSTRYVTTEIEYVPKPIKGITIQEQLALIEKIDFSLKPYVRNTFPMYRVSVIAELEKAHSHLNEAIYLPIHGKELDNLLEARFKQFHKQ